MKNVLFVLTAAFIAILSLNSCEETENVKASSLPNKKRKHG